MGQIKNCERCIHYTEKRCTSNDSEAQALFNDWQETSAFMCPKFLARSWVEHFQNS